jgi:hypothetical protein
MDLKKMENDKKQEKKNPTVFFINKMENKK